METTSKLNKITPKFWNTRYGAINAVSDDNMIVHSLERYGEWAESELDLLSGVLQEGATVLQVGAEYGAHALWLSQTVGPEGEVHVFDADRMANLQLCANAALNGVANIYGYVTGAESKRDVIVDALSLEKLQLIKINPTGTLQSVLGGAGDSIRKHKPYLYFRVGSPELTDAGGDPDRRRFLWPLPTQHAWRWRSRRLSCRGAGNHAASAGRRAGTLRASERHRRRRPQCSFNATGAASFRRLVPGASWSCGPTRKRLAPKCRDPRFTDPAG
ncbi:hypothetical protein [Lysobacter panacisoli]|nr:hypothetical protein [Lysobacter panacisoli]